MLLKLLLNMGFGQMRLKTKGWFDGEVSWSGNLVRVHSIIKYLKNPDILCKNLVTSERNVTSGSSMLISEE